MSEIYEKMPDHQGSDVGMTSQEICTVRQKALGLSACFDCPCSCAVSGENSTRLFNAVDAYPDAFPGNEGLEITGGK